MWVPPCEAGVKPMPPIPASRPLCSSTSATRAKTSSTWMTASTLVIARQGTRAALAATGDLDDRVDQLGRDPVLRHVAGRTGLAGPVDVRARVRAGEHEDARVPVDAADGLSGLDAVHDGHRDVHQDHVRLQLAREVDRLAA